VERFVHAAPQHPFPNHHRKERTMPGTTATLFSHVKPTDTAYQPGGLRDFFLYRDLGIAEATHGKVIAHLVKANMAPETGTGWHRHEADFQIVIMVKGWARFMYEDQVTLVAAGDVVHQRPGIRHYLFDYSPTWSTWKLCRPPISKPWTCPRCATSRRPPPGPDPCHAPRGRAPFLAPETIFAALQHFSCNFPG
jgi:mannose-6-phosphate isomerase-like protein (cupin superfamily)